MNITAPLARLARLRPAHPAIIRADNEPISYARLDSLINAAAHRLQTAGIRPGEVVALDIAGPDEAVGLVIALGLARLGAASAAPSIADADCQHRTGTPALPLDASWLREPAVPAPLCALHPNGTAILRIFASSGTTGLPKHIPVTHDQYRFRM